MYNNKKAMWISHCLFCLCWCPRQQRRASKYKSIPRKDSL